MKYLLIPMLVLAAGVGSFAASGPPADSNLNTRPEVNDSDARLRLILEQRLSELDGHTTAPPSRISRVPPPVTPAKPGNLPGSLLSVPASNPAPAPAPAPAATVAIDPKYLLREGDVIEIKVYQEDDLSARVRLTQEGLVSLPLLGNVRLTGRTVEQARAEVQGLYGKDYLVNPQVLLTVVEYAKRRFSVMGQVQQPGFYNIPENEKLNLLQAISMAGGFTRLANTSRIIIKRNKHGTETVLQVNAQAMGRDKDARLLEIQAEDAIIVSQRIF